MTPSPFFADLLNLAIAALLVSLMMALLTWARMRWEDFKARLKPDIGYEVERYARAGVEFAQQAYRDNQERKNAAVRYAQEWLERAGYGWIDLPTIANEVERQVGREKITNGWAGK